MIIDCYSGAHCSTEPKAVVAYEAAVSSVLSHRPAAGPALIQALSFDPDMTAALALKGFAGVLLAKSETIGAARQDLQLARQALEKRGGSESERALVVALELAAGGRILDAAAGLDQHLGDHPRDLLALKLAHGLRFMGGDAEGMLAATSRVLPEWSSSLPGYGFLLGCHAFGLEETGRLSEAERMGRAAVELEPTDAWGLHAVGHVYEMQGKLDCGIELLERTRAAWSQCNNFSFHMAWHLALFHLGKDEPGRALDIYDREIRPIQTDDFRDIANAVSMLWRLGQDGVAVGERWAELAAIARERRTDTSLVFASLHHLLSLVAAGDLSSAQALVAEIARKAARGDGDQSRVAKTVGLELAEAILSLATGSKAEMRLSELTRNLRLIGGSNAQRDVFMRTLAQIAAQIGASSQVESILAARRRQRSDDRFARTAAYRLSVSREFRRVA